MLSCSYLIISFLQESFNFDIIDTDEQFFQTLGGTSGDVYKEYMSNYVLEQFEPQISDDIINFNMSTENDNAILANKNTTKPQLKNKKIPVARKTDQDENLDLNNLPPGCSKDLVRSVEEVQMRPHRPLQRQTSGRRHAKTSSLILLSDGQNLDASEILEMLQANINSPGIKNVGHKNICKMHSWDESRDGGECSSNMVRKKN